MEFAINTKKQLSIIIPEQPTLLFKSSWEKSSSQYSIFKRFQTRRSRGKHLGDNCPILYALKTLQGLSVSKDTRNSFFAYVEKCIKYHFKDNFPFDVLIVMPSKHDIGTTIANIISQNYKVHVITNYFSKNTPREALNEINKMDIPVSIKDSLKASIDRDMHNLSLKNIHTKYRKYVPILVTKNTWVPVLSEKVLLIDDIVSSGSTLKLARDLILQHSPQLKTVESLVLFGKLNNKI